MSQSSLLSGKIPSSKEDNKFYLFPLLFVSCFIAHQLSKDFISSGTHTSTKCLAPVIVLSAYMPIRLIQLSCDPYPFYTLTTIVKVQMLL